MGDPKLVCLSIQFHELDLFYIVTKLLHVDGIHLFAHLLTLDNVYAMTHQMVI